MRNSGHIIPKAIAYLFHIFLKFGKKRNRLFAYYLKKIMQIREHQKLLMVQMLPNKSHILGANAYSSSLSLLYCAVLMPTIEPMQVQRAAEIVVTISA